MPIQEANCNDFTACLLEIEEFMTNENLAVVPRPKSLEWFEDRIPIRGCRFDLATIKEVYRELSRINAEYGQRLVADLVRDEDMSDEEWDNHKKQVHDDAFRLTVSIAGHRDQMVYAEDADIFTSQNLPHPIKSIYFNNITAFRRNANGNNPPNRIEVTLDFDKPAMLDPNPLVSEATKNGSEVTINADEISYFRAVQQVIHNKLTSRRTGYRFLHYKFIYDIGLWLLALPFALIVSTHYMDKFLPLDGDHASLRWAFFIYSVGCLGISYRLLTSYTKWAFPVNVLSENKDRALKHRLIIGGIVAWVLYKIADTMYELVISSVV